MKLYYYYTTFVKIQFESTLSELMSFSEGTNIRTYIILQGSKFENEIIYLLY